MNPIQKRKITIIRYTKPPEDDDVNKELQYFCNSLGLFGIRDKDKSRYRLFLTLLKAMKNDAELSSDEIAGRLSLCRGTVIHHMHKLVDAGLVIQRKNRYILRVENLEELIDEMEKDVLKTIDGLRQLAKNIDGRLGL